MKTTEIKSLGDGKQYYRTRAEFSLYVSAWVALEEDDRDLLTAWIDATAELSDITKDLKQAQKDFVGKFENEKAAGEHIAHGMLQSEENELPTWILIDYEATWNANLRRDYSTSKHKGYFWVFRNN